MARSHIRTLLPLDEYARVMSIPAWVFNQVSHPGREFRGVCSEPLFQSGYVGDPNIFVGRDEIAQAIATAEQMIAKYLGFWPANKWICEEETVWPEPVRGSQTNNPLLKTEWGYVHKGGVETYALEAGHQQLVYSDEDGDGYDDTATITVIGMYSLYEPWVENKCEVVVVPEGYDPEDNWEIRPLDIDIDADTGVITIIGPRWLFVDPDMWLTANTLEMDDDANFLTHVDVYRHYNDESHQSRIIWRDVGEWETCDDEACNFVSQNACISILSARPGIVSVSPGTYSGGAWSPDQYARCEMPTHVQLWYLSGYDDDTCMDCTQLGPSMKEAIVRLANVYLADAPCTCKPTLDKWKEDRQDLDVRSYARALAERRLGTTARGAVFAMSVVSSLEPLGKGG